MGYDYVELVVGSLKRRNRIVTTDKAITNSPNAEGYRSLFQFDDSFRTYVEMKGSTAGYKGKHTATNLIFDFDNQADLEAVRKEVQLFINVMQTNYNIPLEYWQLYFSGAKGFHAFLPINVIGNVEPAENFSKIYKTVCCELGQGFKFIDTSIYTQNRLIRIPWTINAKTKLFKIPLTFSDLSSLSIDEIMEMARKNHGSENDSIINVKNIPSLTELWEKALVSAKQLTCRDISYSKTLLRPAPNGQRNNTAISICGTLIQQGHDINETLSILSEWNKTNIEPLPGNELFDLARGAYSRYGKASITKEHRIHTLAESEREFEKIVDTLENEKIRIGFSEIDRRIRLFTSGMMFTIVAKSGNGKSSLAQFISMRHAKSSKKPVLYFSLEMPDWMVFERALQIENDKTAYQISESYKINRAEGKKNATASLREYQKFFVCSESGLTIQDISDCVLSVELKTSEKVGLIVVDYLSLMQGVGKDNFEKASNIALGLKQIAKNLSIGIILLVQTTKEYRVDTPLNENSAKDTGSILEASDFQLSMWLISDSNEWKNMIVRLTKNRNGTLGKDLSVRMNKRSLRWEQQEGQ